jgi:hypothetical protein
MNRQQLVEIVKGLLVAGGPVVILLVHLLGMEQSGAEKIAQALAGLVSVGGIVWMAMGKSDTAMAKDAASLPGVQVHVDTRSAAANVVDVALDRGVKDVIPMIGGPRSDTNKAN